MSHSLSISKWQYLLAAVLVAAIMLGFTGLPKAEAKIVSDNPTVTSTKVVGSKTAYAADALGRRYPAYRICKTTTRTMSIGATPIQRVERTTADGRPFVELIYQLTESYSGRTYKVAGRFKCGQNYGRTLSEWALPNMKSQISDFVVGEAPASS